MYIKNIKVHEILWKNYIKRKYILCEDTKISDFYLNSALKVNIYLNHGLIEIY